MRVAIVGTGFRGLSLGYYIKKFNPHYKITFIEQSQRIGGWIDSETTAYGIAEKAARTIRSSGEGAWNIAEICSDIKIDNRVITVSKLSESGKNRAIIVNGKVQMLPNGISSLLKPQYLKEILRFISRRRHILNHDVSVEEFFLSNFGPTFANLSSAMCHGIFASNNAEMSVLNHFGFIKNALEMGNGNLLLGMYRTKAFKPLKVLELWERIQKSAVWGFDDGMNVLTDGLAKHLSNSEWQMNTKIKSAKLRSKVVELDGKPYDQVYWTCAMDKSLFGKDSPVAPQQSLYVVNLFYPDHLKYRSAFGILNTKSEMKANPNRGDLLGIIFDSEIRKRPGYSQFTVMLGGYQFRKYTDDEAMSIAHQHVNELVFNGAATSPVYGVCTLQNNCIPYYPIASYNNILERRRDLESLYLNKIKFISQDFAGVGMTECARIAKLEAIAISPDVTE